jgi:AcrR family transcriptional regulator
MLMDENHTTLAERTLTEAARLFVQFGYNGISMRQIAEACHVSKPALYYHFKDKEALFVAILERYLDELGRQIEDCRELDGARAQVRAVITSILRQPAEQRAIMRLATQDISHLSSESRARFGELYQQRFIGQIDAILLEGQKSGELRPEFEFHLATWALLGMLYPFTFPGRESRLDLNRAANELSEIFLHGLGR